MIGGSSALRAVKHGLTGNQSAGLCWVSDSQYPNARHILSQSTLSVNYGDQLLNISAF